MISVSYGNPDCMVRTSLTVRVMVRSMVEELVLKATHELVLNETGVG